MRVKKNLMKKVMRMWDIFTTDVLYFVLSPSHLLLSVWYLQSLESIEEDEPEFSEEEFSEEESDRDEVDSREEEPVKKRVFRPTEIGKQFSKMGSSDNW